LIYQASLLVVIITGEGVLLREVSNLNIVRDDEEAILLRTLEVAHPTCCPIIETHRQIKLHPHKVSITMSQLACKEVRQMSRFLAPNKNTRKIQKL